MGNFATIMYICKHSASYSNSLYHRSHHLAALFSCILELILLKKQNSKDNYIKFIHSVISLKEHTCSKSQAPYNRHRSTCLTSAIST